MDKGVEVDVAVLRAAGALSIPVVALLLRRLGVADELFTGLIFELLLLYCVVEAHTSRANRLPWAAFAGLFGGLVATVSFCYQCAPP